MAEENKAPVEEAKPAANEPSEAMKIVMGDVLAQQAPIVDDEAPWPFDSGRCCPHYGFVQ